MEIEKKLDGIPASPGVYMMKGRDGGILYIGKAKNLRSRVRSYFRKTGDGRYAVRFIAGKTHDIDYILTANEKEALILEDTLLKSHKPKYNIQLKDSKTYVSIKLTMQEEFPRILVTRLRKRDGSRYFGPYVSARAVRETVKLLRKIFPLCVCSESVFRNRKRPCLDYQLGICSAPAVGLISKEDYMELVKGAILFLEGKNKELLRDLKGKMAEAAGAEDFETAAELRDRVIAIEEMLEKQRVVSARAVDQDIIAVSSGAVSEGAGYVAVQVLFVRDGRLVNSSSHIFRETGLPGDEVVSSFVTQFYRGERYVPDEVVLDRRTEDMELLSEWLGERAGRRVRVVVPSRGDKLKLLMMAEENAAEAIRKKTDAEASQAALVEALRKRLRLSNLPQRIEAFDISNLGGTLAVGAMVAFAGGEPEKDRYRLFRIKGVEGQDDYAMMKEVLTRRYAGAAEEGEGVPPPPDLVLMDGGKGQLNIAVKVLEELGITGVDVAALAKDRPLVPGKAGGERPGGKGERVFLPGAKDPVMLREGSKPDLLLRRIRDEVHRFAITYQRRLRGKRAVTSVLEEVPGIGPKKKKALFERFGDLDGIRRAGVDELTKVPGITAELAERIRERLEGSDSQ